MLNRISIKIGLILTAVVVAILGCKSSAPQTNPSPNAAAKEDMIKAARANEGKASTKELANKPKSEPERKVKAFTFEPPSSAWTVAKPGAGDGILSTAEYSLSSSATKVAVTSIGLPPKGNEAEKLVRNCESEYAQGAAKHADSTREWISHGFSISRFADPATGQVMVWCVSNDCKVRLNFEFGSGSKLPDNVKTADASTDEFFTKNPTGGAVIK